ncbi:VOC family protein [Thermodesulfobacteriota bacterium]
MYKHTNMIAKDWRALAAFYEDVLGCTPVPPKRNLSGAWLDKGTGVRNARFSGMHLRLPGCGENGPTLEIYQYEKNEPRPKPAANREGLSHIAFEVEDVEKAATDILNNGGGKLGEISSSQVAGVGLLTFVYVTDPEGNIIELQAWVLRKQRYS